jgi:mannitol 2-dehydrogenase
MIVVGLSRRRDAGILPFTVVSCDNILHNGNAARSVVLELADQSGDGGLTEWIKMEVAFPNGKFFF